MTHSYATRMELELNETVA